MDTYNLANLYVYTDIVMVAKRCSNALPWFRCMSLHDVLSIVHFTHSGKTILSWICCLTHTPYLLKMFLCHFLNASHSLEYLKPCLISLDVIHQCLSMKEEYVSQILYAISRFCCIQKQKINYMEVKAIFFVITVVTNLLFIICIRRGYICAFVKPERRQGQRFY